MFLLPIRLSRIGYALLLRVFPQYVRSAAIVDYGGGIRILRGFLAKAK
jgi:hypothetical protein